MKFHRRPLILILQMTLVVSWQAGYATRDSSVAETRRSGDWDDIRARALAWVNAQGEQPSLAAAPQRVTATESQAPALAVLHDEGESSRPETAFQETALVPLQPEAEPSPEPAAKVDTTPAAVARIVAPSGFKGGTVVASADLDRMRGGFETPSGLQFTFGITQAVFVNGEMIATQTINLVNAALARNPVTVPVIPTPTITVSVRTPLAPVTQGTAPVAQGTAPVTQGTAPVAQGTAPVTQGTAPVAQGTAPVTQGTAPVTQGTAPVTQGTAPVTQGTAPVTQGTAPVTQGTAPVTQGTAPVTQGTAPVTQGTTAVVTTQTNAAIPTLVIQNGPGNSVDVSNIGPGASPLIIQNSLSNQHIRTETTINAAVPALSIMRSVSQMRAIEDGIRNAAAAR